MLLVVPEVPGLRSTKPLVQGYGARLRGDALSCEALFAAVHIPDQTLTAELHERGKHPRRVRLDWTSVEPRVLHKDAVIDLAKE